MKVRTIEEMLRDPRPIAGGDGSDDPPKDDPPKDDPPKDDPPANDPPKEDPKPPWGSAEDFDPDKAWRLVQNLRSERDGLKEKANKLKELEDSQKTDAEKLTDKAADAEKRAQEAEQRALRLEVAADKGLTPAQAKRLVGTTKEELEADADELLESFKPTDDKKGGTKPSGRPRERLRGGTDPTDEPEESDPRKLAAKVPRTSGGF